MQFVYLDNAASTKPLRSVNEAFNFINIEHYSNPSSSHILGIEAEKILDRSRSEIASFLNLKPNEVIFTSGGTESINTAIRGIYNAHSKKRKNIISTKVEHSAVDATLSEISKKGASISYLDLNSKGKIMLSSLKKLLSKDTLMISIIHVNNETGVINPVYEISRIVKAYDPEIFIHVDCVQSFGKLDILNDIKYVDLISCSAHKIHGPKGIGALYLKNKIRIDPLITGGGQENKLRSGTTNLPLIYAFASVVKEIKENQLIEYKKITSLKQHLLKKFVECDLNHKINFEKDCSPYILNVSFPGIKSEILMHFLEKENIIVSAGAACSSKKNKNRVLKEYGISDKLSESAIRISFSKYTTMDEIDLLFETLNKIIKDL